MDVTVDEFPEFGHPVTEVTYVKVGARCADTLRRAGQWDERYYQEQV